MQPARDMLILGASPNVGAPLYERVGPSRALATWRRAPVEGGVRFDALTDDLALLLDAHPGIRSAVILYGETHPDRCFADPAGSESLNVDSIRRAIDILRARGVFIVFLSSQFVFDGEAGNYVETDPANPVLLYGAQKIRVERHLEESCERYAILRLSKSYADAPGDGTMFCAWADEILGGARRIRCAADQIFSPILGRDIVDAILAVIEGECRGLYHLCAPGAYRRIEMLEILIAELSRHFPVAVDIEPCSIRDFALPEPRPLDVSMQPARLIAATGLHFVSIEEACRGIAGRYAAARA